MDIMLLLKTMLVTSESEILKFSATAPHRYKKYRIPKRNGDETRRIAQPSKELKFIQRLIVNKLESTLPVHSSAKAYRAGVSIKDNALKHQNTRYMLKMDFKDFFPSIEPQLFFKVASSCGINFSKLDQELLSNLLFYKLTRRSKLKLSIGAPSSPLISNFVMYFFDAAIYEYCSELGVNYTRYADDLTFSTNRKDVLFEFPNVISEQLKKYSYGLIKVNLNKTVFSSKGHNRHVTGITITNDSKLSLGRSKKRMISSLIHKYSLGILTKKQTDCLRGHISFAKFVEPAFFSRVEKKYGKEVIQSIFSD